MTWNMTPSIEIKNTHHLLSGLFLSKGQWSFVKGLKYSRVVNSITGYIIWLIEDNKHL